MRLRRKPWIDDAIKEYESFVHLDNCEAWKGKWRSLFSNPQASLCVELGTGKGKFILQMAQLHPDINYIGIEVQRGVLYYAAKKIAEARLTNVRLLQFNVANLTDIFAEGEIDRFYINFCDPWPKSRHAKRRLTYRGFLERYAGLLTPGGQVFFKSDNAPLFDFTLEEFVASGWKLADVTYNLHNSPILNEAMTEYEEKFSAKGQPIFHCEATRPIEVIRHGPGE